MVHARLRRDALEPDRQAIARAKRRVRICSPVITAAPVLSILAQVVSEGRVDVAGCVDQPQVHGVIYQWRENGNVAWKLPLLERVMQGEFSGKPSEPWHPGGGLHNFMHAKVTVADDVIFLGSFNLSRSGEKNAENVLEFEDAALAERLAAYIDEVRALPAVHVRGTRSRASRPCSFACSSRPCRQRRFRCAGGRRPRRGRVEADYERSRAWLIARRLDPTCSACCT